MRVQRNLHNRPFERKHYIINIPFASWNPALMGRELKYGCHSSCFATPNKPRFSKFTQPGPTNFHRKKDVYEPTILYQLVRGLSTADSKLQHSYKRKLWTSLRITLSTNATALSTVANKSAG
jgi:hypothetical protein